MEIKIDDSIINMLSLAKMSSDKFHASINRVCPMHGEVQILEDENYITIKSEEKIVARSKFDKIAVIEKINDLYSWCWMQIDRPVLEKIKSALPDEYRLFREKQLVYFTNSVIITAIESYIYDIGEYQHILAKKYNDTEMYVLYCLYDVDWMLEEIRPS